MNQSRYIDENDLPFTEDEIFRALALTGDEQGAREGTRFIAELLLGGTYDGGWSIGDQLFASLALLSDDLRERVESYKRPQWEAMRAALVHIALRQQGLPPGSAPTASALRSAEEAVAAHVADWRRGGATLADWVRRRQEGEAVGDEPPPWPGSDED